MKVHYITSRPALEQHINTLRKTVKVIQDAGHTLAYAWIEEAHSRTNDEKADWEKIYKDNLETITKADVVIAEASYDSFGVGYQVAFAVHHKKPVLLLRHEDADENIFAAGVVEGWVVNKKYNDETLSSIINDFLDDNDIQNKDMRFNFFIDRKIYNYLRWASYKTGKTKAAVLRELVEKEIDSRSQPDEL